MEAADTNTESPVLFVETMKQARGYELLQVGIGNLFTWIQKIDCALEKVDSETK